MTITMVVLFAKIATCVVLLTTSLLQKLTLTKTNTMNIKELCNELFNQTNNSEDLRLVWDTAKSIQDKLAGLARREFSIGQEVQFESKHGLVQGRVSKINKKSIKVTSLGGVMWRVAPTLLSPLSMER